MPSRSLVYRSRTDFLLTGASPPHACGSGKTLKQLDETSRPLAGCALCVVSLCSFFPFPPSLGRKETLELERF